MAASASLSVILGKLFKSMNTDGFLQISIEINSINSMVEKKLFENSHLPIFAAIGRTADDRFVGEKEILTL